MDRQPVTQDSSQRRSTAQLAVSVGTDHHPFDRLIEWVDEWRDGHPDVVAVVQAGTSNPSRHGDSRELIPHGELLEIFARATVVVSHGGPSTVMDARQSGRLPIVVARNPEFGEHVDDHQMRFADHLDHHGMAIVIHDKQGLFDALDRAFAEPERFAVAVDSSAASGVARFGQVVDRLLETTTPIAERRPSVDASTRPEPQSRPERRRAIGEETVAGAASTKETTP